MSETAQPEHAECTAPEPTEQHNWLRQLVGDWAYVSEAPNGPDAEPLRAEGTESVAMMGDLWMVAENQGNAPGMGPMRARMTVGYDPRRERFVGHWFCTIMAGHFVYEGTLDETGRILTLDTDGPDFNDPSRTAHYQDIIELVDDSTRLMRSRIEGPDGEWTEIMRSVFTRA